MKYVTCLDLFAKLISTVAIFVFVRRVEDYRIVPALYSCGGILSGLLGLMLLSKTIRIRCSFPTLSLVQEELREGFHIFVSSLLMNAYSATNTILLGLLTNNATVAYFSAASKVTGAIGRLFRPIQLALFPFISNVVQKSREEGTETSRKNLAS